MVNYINWSCPCQETSTTSEEILCKIQYKEFVYRRLLCTKLFAGYLIKLDRVHANVSP